MNQEEEKQNVLSLVDQWWNTAKAALLTTLREQLLVFREYLMPF